MATPKPLKETSESKDAPESKETAQPDPVTSQTGRAEPDGELTKDGDPSDHDPADKRGEYDESLRKTLTCPAGRAWLEGELSKAVHAVEHGPDGQGWHYNESLREPISARATFLRAIMVILDAARDAAKD